MLLLELGAEKVSLFTVMKNTCYTTTIRNTIVTNSGSC